MLSWAFPGGLATALTLLSARALTCEWGQCPRDIWFPLLPSTTVCSKEAPTQFTLSCPFHFSSVLCCADYGGLGPTSGPPEISAVGPGTSQRGPRQPSERKTHRTIPLFWVRAAELSPALCKATDEPSSVPLWTHTPSYLFPKRGSGVAHWGLFVKPGMFCANESLRHGWLTGWKRACRGPGDSSWMRVMWNQVGCFWGRGTLARRIWMGNSLYCMSSLPSPRRRKDISLRGTAMLATSEFVLRRGCWFVLQGEWEKLLHSQSSAHYSQWWQLCCYAGPAYHCAVKVGL